MPKKVIAAILLFFFIVWGSCSSGLTFRFLKPGQIHFAGIKRLAIAPCTGLKEAGKLQDRLNQKLEETHYFSLLYDKNISDLLWQHQLTYQKIAEADSQTLSEIGGWLKVDGMLFTELKTLEIEFVAEGLEKIEKKVWTGEYERDEFGEIIEIEDSTGQKIKKKKLKVKILNQKFQLRQAKIEVYFRLLDFELGRIIGSWDKVEHYVENTALTEAPPKLLTEEAIKDLLINRAIDEFVKEIGPQIEFVKRHIESGFAQLDSGVVYAKKNLWEKAIAFWEQAEKTNPTDARVYYNLGLAYEALGDYKSAEMHYFKASLLNPENKRYRKAIDNIKKIWIEKEKNK